MNLGLTDQESWVCPTWSQLPLRVQKHRYLLTTITHRSLASLQSGSLFNQKLSESGYIISPRCRQAKLSAPENHVILTPVSCSFCSFCSGEPGSHFCLTRPVSLGPNTAFYTEIQTPLCQAPSSRHLKILSHNQDSGFI